MVATEIASSSFPQDMFRKREVGRVSVLILVAPAIIRTAPNSPIPFDQVITDPATRPFEAIGRVTLQRAWPSVHPRVLATCS